MHTIQAHAHKSQPVQVTRVGGWMLRWNSANCPWSYVAGPCRLQQHRNMWSRRPQQKRRPPKKRLLKRLLQIRPRMAPLPGLPSFDA